MSERRKVLHAGAGRYTQLPPHYRDFVATTVDIDAATQPDLVADVRDLSFIEDESFDAVYAAHLLEHFPPWELPFVLGELTRVLKVGGFLEVRVPFGEAVFTALSQGHPLHGPLYESSLGPITPHDILYGHGPSIRAGQDAMAHRTVFTTESLRQALADVGLSEELLMPTGGTRYELSAIGRRVAVDSPALSPEDLAEAMLAT